jgi:hypothetical protein
MEEQVLLIIEHFSYSLMLTRRHVLFLAQQCSCIATVARKHLRWSIFYRVVYRCLVARPPKGPLLIGQELG